MKILSFSEWQEHQLATMSADEDIRCPDCDGNGVAECDHCGHDSDCERCFGEGVLEFGSLGENEKRMQLDEQSYKQAVIKDISDIAKWKGVPPESALVDFGFNPWMSIRGSRELRI